MKRTKKSGVVFLLLAALSGCSSLTTPTPLGAPVEVEVAARFDGVWVADDDDITLRVHHAADGRLRLAGLEWDDDTQSFKMFTRDLLLGHADDGWLFVNAPQAQWDDDEPLSDADPRQGPFYPALITASTEDAPDQATLYFPDYDAWATAVEDGALAGAAQRNDQTIDVTVTADPDEIAAFLAGRAVDTLFDMDEPAELRRVAEPD